jgi:hypothetical protein
MPFRFSYILTILTEMKGSPQATHGAVINMLKRYSGAPLGKEDQAEVGT